MGISKFWLEEQIKNETDANAKLAFELCYDELIKPPVRATKQAKSVDHNKVYDDTFQFYLKKGYTPDEAHEIAMKVVRQQQQKKALHNFEDSPGVLEVYKDCLYYIIHLYYIIQVKLLHFIYLGVYFV